MSFELRWDLLKDGVEAERLRQLLNERFQEVERPSFLGALTVTELDFGDIPPELTIVDICDPLPEFYIQEDSDYISDDNSRHLPGGPTRAGGGGSSSRHPHPVGGGYTSSSSNLIEDERGYVHAPRQDTDAQLELSVAYHGNMRLSISTELIVNQPTPAFMVLPLTLTVTGFSFEATAVIAYLGYMINFCLKEPLNGEPTLRDMTIESEIGDKNKQVLKNVTKIEKFIVMQLKKLFNDFLVYPNYHSLYLVQEDDDPDVSDVDARDRDLYSGAGSATGSMGMGIGMGVGMGMPPGFGSGMGGMGMPAMGGMGMGGMRIMGPYDPYLVDDRHMHDIE
ncbi:hypothetical protein BC831DRAFT_455589 [Entophlyctis helioformis]|nr:hypothetical protein BC831DRAFT_455589 [Entophlyctis helioformis]